MTLVHPHGPGWKVLGGSCKVLVQGEHNLAPGSCSGPCAVMMMRMRLMMMIRMRMRVNLRNLQMVRPCPGS